MRQQTAPYSLLSMVAIDDQPADHDKRFGLDVFGDQHMNPADGCPVAIGDEKLLIGTAQHARESIGNGGHLRGVAKLLHKRRNRLGIGRSCRSDGDVRSAHRFERRTICTARSIRRTRVWGFFASSMASTCSR